MGEEVKTAIAGLSIYFEKVQNCAWPSLKSMLSPRFPLKLCHTGARDKIEGRNQPLVGR